MNKTFEKRDSLERFIREQILGPGISGYRFIDLENKDLLKKNIIKEKPIDYSNEIIDIVPAAVYSTGILFPEDKSGTCNEGIILDNNEIIDQKDVSDQEETQNNSSDDIGTSDRVDINQMFPRTMGLTCCFDEAVLQRETFEFKVKFRYYQRLWQDKQEKIYNNYGLLCEVNHVEVQRFISTYELNSFRIYTINDNHILLLSKISTDTLNELKARIKEIQKQIAETYFDEANSLSRLPHLSRATSYLSNLKSSIFYELKNTITNNDIRKKLYDLSQNIELVECITDHFRNLLEVFSGGYGLWQSKTVERKIRIQNLKVPQGIKKKSILYNKAEDDINIIVFKEDGTISEGLKDLFRFDIDDKKDDYASLSANVQVTRDSRNASDKLFFKIQLINTSTAFNKDKKNDNRYYSTFNELVNQKSFFGVKLSVESDYLVPYRTHFYHNEGNDHFSEDTTTAFTYDQFKDYAIGHGCSVKWSIDGEKRLVETEYLPSCETPDIDALPRDKRGKIINDDQDGLVCPLFIENTKSQEFKWLSIFSDATDTEIVLGLQKFVDAYGRWIESKRTEEKYKGIYSAIAKQELDKCEYDFLRMKNNITKIFSGNHNKENIISFRLMNSAMFMQLWHSVKAKNSEVKSYMDQDDFTSFNSEFYVKADDRLFAPFTQPAGWRAFQLAFILLNIDGIFQTDGDTKWDKRNNWVDLVWFPTGGGKTEAYLGLIALTIINRRKEYNENGGGTAAIMRYTLRLLTMQQFQRASLVIMALELIRRWGKFHLGDEPICIGLWVGDNSLPNKNQDLILEFKNLNYNISNKIPFSTCPWCNSKLEAEINADNESNTSVFLKNRIHLCCASSRCSFHYPRRRSRARRDQMPIPVCLSDETIYQHPPTLLFGTVDKFAQLAHKVNGQNNGRNLDSRRIFGIGNWEEGKPKDGYLPPDLIIQDELHLLLGPLGSAVALFESAVDQLCTRKDGTRPKIISSTATTRNTQLQIAALFDRKVNIFPKSGVECDDSFYAFYKRRFKSIEDKTSEYICKRKYIGLLPTGRTQIWMQMRLAAIIMTHRAIFELNELREKHPIDYNSYQKFERSVDYYHTLISYFNSLKEVGKTQSQIQTYILKELRRVFSRNIRPQKLMHSLYTYGPIIESELTGRLSGEEVKNELKSVESKWSAINRFAHLENNELIKGKVPPEFVVATNMISVGIDVSRFNTIIINSMPRNTAEYIQASSRVARNDFGLVLTIHHPFRARDISHYEKFIEFHEKMYSYVEPISITPFTLKAVERYMGLYLATILRHKTRFTERFSAADISKISDTEISVMISELTHYFEERKNRMRHYDLAICTLLTNDNVEQIKKWIQEALFEWKQESNKVLADNKAFVFNNKSVITTPPQEQLYVDIEEYEGNIHSKKWQIPMSLRVIEPEAALKINHL